MQETLYQLAQSNFTHGNMILVLLLVFFGGVLTSLSPCVYPIIPITLSVIGARQQASVLQGFFKSVAYVGGMVTLYAALGVASSYFGFMFGSFLQNPIVLFLVGLFFIVMSMSMFGIFTLQLPQKLLGPLVSVGGGRYGHAFAMGLVAGVIAAPCTGPVLAFILTMIALRQDLLIGALYMFAFALGMGLPFLLLGAFGNLLTLLPKSGHWMNVVKYLLGSLILGVGIYYITLSIPFMHGHSETSNSLQWVKIDTGLTHMSEVDRLLEQARSTSKPVLIDFYADWCAACHQLDEITYQDALVQQALLRFMRIKVDLTQDTPELLRLQNRFQIVGLPATVLIDNTGFMKPILYGYIHPAQFLGELSKVK